jgi:hypothetical protein
MLSLMPPRPNPPSSSTSQQSFAERHLDAEPHSYDKDRYDGRDDSLECIALRLLDALTPASQVVKIRAKLLAIIF